MEIYFVGKYQEVNNKQFEINFTRLQIFVQVKKINLTK